jgi:hypothetical protein
VVAGVEERPLPWWGNRGEFPPNFHISFHRQDAMDAKAHPRRRASFARHPGRSARPRERAGTERRDLGRPRDGGSFAGGPRSRRSAAPCGLRCGRDDGGWGPPARRDCCAVGLTRARFADGHQHGLLSDGTPLGKRSAVGALVKTRRKVAEARARQVVDQDDGRSDDQRQSERRVEEDPTAGPLAEVVRVVAVELEAADLTSPMPIRNSPTQVA